MGKMAEIAAEIEEMVGLGIPSDLATEMAYRNAALANQVKGYAQSHKNMLQEAVFALGLEMPDQGNQSDDEYMADLKLLIRGH